MKRFAPLLVLGCLFVAACSGGSSPTAPGGGNSSTPTKIISLGGNLSFGAVTLNVKATGLLTITNSGNTALTVTSIGAPCTSFFAASFTSGTIAPGATQNVTITFTPTSVTTCNGNITVTADQTSGTNTIPMAASGTLDGIAVFSKSGSGNTVFDIPAYVKRIHITGIYNGFSSNFIVHIAGAHIVNDLVGTTRGTNISDGTYLIAGGGTVETIDSLGVAWTFTEVR